jgi:hypothetical protein
VWGSRVLRGDGDIMANLVKRYLKIIQSIINFSLFSTPHLYRLKDIKIENTKENKFSFFLTSLIQIKFYPLFTIKETLVLKPK